MKINAKDCDGLAVVFAHDGWRCGCLDTLLMFGDGNHAIVRDVPGAKLEEFSPYFVGAAKHAQAAATERKAVESKRGGGWLFLAGFAAGLLAGVSFFAGGFLQ